MGRPLPPGLDVALDRARVDEVLRNLAAEHFGSAAQIGEITAEVLRRRVVRYEVEIDEQTRWGVIGKVYESQASGAHGFAALRWLGDRGFADAAPTTVSAPRAFGYVPELQLLLMEEVRGRSLKDLLKSGAARPEHLRLFAAALAKLHRFPAVFGTPFTLDDHLARRCAGLTGPLARAFPAAAPAIARVIAEARRTEAALTPADLGLAHGDCHPGQVHLEGDRLWLVDLDPLNHGDPAYDVAMVVLGLKRMEARAEPDARALRDAFLAEYFAHMDLALAARVPLHAALIFLKRACKRFRWQDEPDWEADVRVQLRRAEECLAWGEAHGAPRGLPDALALCARCPEPNAV